MSSSVFSETLQSITSTKLNELSKKRKIFEDQKTKILTAATKVSDPKARLRILLDGVKKCFSVKSSTKKRGNRSTSPTQFFTGNSNDPELEAMLKNLERFLEQARFDPSISPELLLEWEQSLLSKLNIQSRKFQYATLYGELVTEWLVSEKSSVSTDAMSDISEDFVNVQKAQKEDSRSKWEKLVFEPFETDQMAITEYLRDLFGETGRNKQASKALEALRKKVRSFGNSLTTPNQFDDSVLNWVIGGLLASGLLSDEKRAVLRDFLANPVILAEVADVLNMRIAAISTWSWENEVSVEQRRHVTGAFHIYIDEELLQAIFLQYIGIKWSVFFKQHFVEFTNYDGAWASLRENIPIVDRKRREYFLGQQHKKWSIQAKRQAIYKSIFFMSQLPDSPYAHESSSAVEGEEEVMYESRPLKRSRSNDAQPDGNHALQDYQMQLMQLNQQNKNRLMMARQQQEPMMQAQAQAQAQQQQQIQAAQQQQMMQQARQPAVYQQNLLQQPNGMQPMSMAMNLQPYSSTNNQIHNSHKSDEYDLESEYGKPQSPMEIKHFLLHLLSSEILVNTKLHGDFTCARSEFFSWSPTLPHSTITSVLSYFGMSDKWLTFFNKFLSAPLKFSDDDDSVLPRPRKRGVPGAHSLSSICGEAVLFCLDFAVNQSTNGTQLYRMHDDFWIMSRDHSTVVKGWASITQFTEIMGVSLNASKTGTVRITGNNSSAPIDPSLPSGDIRWGFLMMHQLSGKFVIDQSMVDKHIKELAHQLESKTSVFSWIKAWNTYANTFFKSNFGKPSNCFGREHVDMLLSTMTHIQSSLFNNSNVVLHLKGMLNDRFGTDNIPDGYIYFPTSLGGLELQNPFISLLQVRNNVVENPAELLEEFLENEKEQYRKAKAVFEKGNVHRHQNIDPRFVPTDHETFFSFEEFVRWREEYEIGLKTTMEELLEKPQIEGLVETGTTSCIEHNPVELDGYGKWIVGMYGKEMKARFGGLSVVEKGLLPMGMVGLFRSGRVRWQD